MARNSQFMDLLEDVQDQAKNKADLLKGLEERRQAKIDLDKKIPALSKDEDAVSDELATELQAFREDLFALKKKARALAVKLHSEREVAGLDNRTYSGRSHRYKKGSSELLKAMDQLLNHKD